MEHAIQHFREQIESNLGIIRAAEEVGFRYGYNGAETTASDVAYYREKNAVYARLLSELGSSFTQ
jgi:hypothetical protein